MHMDKKTVKIVVEFNGRKKAFYSGLPMEEAISHVMETVRDSTPIRDLPNKYTITAEYIED
jgi:hypothetical protein